MSVALLILINLKTMENGFYSNYDTALRAELEDEILGWCITIDDQKLRSKSYLHNHGIDSEEYFSNPFNKDVFISMKTCWEHSLPADLKNVINLRPSNYRNPENVADRMGFDLNVITMVNKGNFQTQSNFEQKLWVLKQYVLMDYWNDMAKEILSKQWDFRDYITVSDNIINGYNLLFEKMTRSFVKQDSVVDQERAKYQLKKAGGVVTVPSGIVPVDSFTGGWVNGEMIIVAGRPGMGKTTMALIMAMNAAFLYGKKVLYCSREMPKVQLMNKVLAYQLKLDYKRVKAQDYDDETMEQVFKYYAFLESDKCPLTFTDPREVYTVSQVDAKIKQLQPDVVYIDYLQLMTIESGIKIKAGNREQEISYISNSFKQMAIKYNIPIIPLSQLSRAVESRAIKRPQLSDLRESGSIEQDADIVIFLYRDAYYKTVEGRPVSDSEQWLMEMKFAKGRDLGTKTIYLNANLATYEVTEVLSAPAPPTV